MRSPSRTRRSRSTPWVDGCCGPMLRTMSALDSSPARFPARSAEPMPTPTVRCVVTTRSCHPKRPRCALGSCRGPRLHSRWRAVGRRLAATARPAASSATDLGRSDHGRGSNPALAARSAVAWRACRRPRDRLHRLGLGGDRPQLPVVAVRRERRRPACHAGACCTSSSLWCRTGACSSSMSMLDHWIDASESRRCNCIRRPQRATPAFLACCRMKPLGFGIG